MYKMEFYFLKEIIHTYGGGGGGGGGGKTRRETK